MVPFLNSAHLATYPKQHSEASQLFDVTLTFACNVSLAYHDILSKKGQIDFPYFFIQLYTPALIDLREGVCMSFLLGVQYVFMLFVSP